MTGEAYKEFGAESYLGELPAYGLGSGDGESFRVDYDSIRDNSEDTSDIKIEADDGSISYIEARKPVPDEPKYSEPDQVE